MKKLDRSHDSTDRLSAIRLLDEAREKQQFITGLIYVNEGRPDLREHESLPETPLAHLPEAKVRPPKETLLKLMEGMK